MKIEMIGAAQLGSSQPLDRVLTLGVVPCLLNLENAKTCVTYLIGRSTDLNTVNGC